MRPANRFRIAVVAACPFPWRRGTPIRIRRLAQVLAQRGHQVHVVTYHLGESTEGDPFRVHRIRNVGWYRKHAPGPSYAKFLVLDPLLQRTLRRVLRQQTIDIVHAHHYEGILAARWARPACPVVYDAHTTLESELPFYRLGLPAGFKRIIGRRLDQLLPAKAAHVIAVSERIRDRLIDLGAVDPDRIDVIPSGLEPALLAAAGSPNPAAGKGTVGFAGNLGPYQGIEYLLRAFSEVLRERADTRLLIITTSSFAPYEARARELGIRGSISLRVDDFSELPRNLSEADVLVNPRPEAAGLPQKLLNYMASGRPIVSFDGSACHLRDGKTALVVKSADVPSMAAAILRLLDDRNLAGQLARAARKQAADEFTWDARAAQVEAVYERLLSRAGLLPQPAGSSGR